MPGTSGTAFSVFLPFGEEPDNQRLRRQRTSAAAAESPSEPSEIYAPGPFIEHQYAVNSLNIARRFAVVAAMVLAALEFTGLWIDGDAFAVRPVTISNSEAVTHLL